MGYRETSASDQESTQVAVRMSVVQAETGKLHSLLMVWYWKVSEINFF